MSKIYSYYTGKKLAGEIKGERMTLDTENGVVSIRNDQGRIIGAIKLAPGSYVVEGDETPINSGSAVQA